VPSEATERCADLLGEELRLLPDGEVAASVDFVEVTVSFSDQFVAAMRRRRSSKASSGNVDVEWTDVDDGLDGATHDYLRLVAAPINAVTGMRHAPPS
jgi:hypothetical protein